MNFFNNPKYSALRIVIIIILLAGIAYFAAASARKSNLDQSGRVIETADKNNPEIGGCGSVSNVTYSNGNCTVYNCAGEQSGSGSLSDDEVVSCGQDADDFENGEGDFGQASPAQLDCLGNACSAAINGGANPVSKEVVKPAVKR